MQSHAGCYDTFITTTNCEIFGFQNFVFAYLYSVLIVYTQKRNGHVTITVFLSRGNSTGAVLNSWDVKYKMTCHVPL